MSYFELTVDDLLTQIVATQEVTKSSMEINLPVNRLQTASPMQRSYTVKQFLVHWGMYTFQYFMSKWYSYMENCNPNAANTEIFPAFIITPFVIHIQNPISYQLLKHKQYRSAVTPKI